MIFLDKKRLSDALSPSRMVLRTSKREREQDRQSANLVVQNCTHTEFSILILVSVDRRVERETTREYSMDPGG